MAEQGNPPGIVCFLLSILLCFDRYFRQKL